MQVQALLTLFTGLRCVFERLYLIISLFLHNLNSRR